MEERRTPADEMRRLADERITEKDRTALHALMAGEEGRWFLMRLFERCHMVGGGAFPEGDVHRLLMMEGERRVGLHLQNLVMADPVLLAEKQRAETEYYALMHDLVAGIAAAEEKEDEV